ncbi:DUF2125 domain-containing protein [Hellea sp.]|nr:DUF2125 domain-containing protein [Hellea sp.]
MSGAKKLIIILMTLFVLLCAYWAVGRNIMIKGITDKIDTLQSEGYKVVHKGLSVGGFPFKFRARLAELEVAAPRSDTKPWSIKGDDWRMEALTLNPFIWTAIHRGEARIDMRGPKGERWLFDAQPMNVEVTARVNMSGALTAYSLTSTKLKTEAIIGTLPPIIAIDDAQLQVRREGEDMRYAAELKNIYLEKSTLEAFQRAFGPRIDRLSGAAMAVGLHSLDEAAIEAWKTAGQLTGEGWELSWGGTNFVGGFNLTQSGAGLSGVIRIEVEDIKALISRLEDAAILSANQARNAKLASVLLPVNGEGRQEITLTLRDGFITLFGQRIYAL